MKPLLFVDVDGVLNPYAANPLRRPIGYATHRMNPLDQHGATWVSQYGKPLRVWLNPSHGSYLLALPYELVWATTWAAEANIWIAPHVGLPELPVVDWPEVHAVRDDGTYFKTHDLVRYAAGRPFAWVDDEIGPADREYVTRHHAGAALLHHVNPRLGLLDDDFHELHVWASKLSGGGS